MTTIAFKNGYMAADSRGYSGSERPIGSKSKLFDLPDGSVLGISTDKPGFSELVGKYIREAIEAGETERPWLALSTADFAGFGFHEFSFYALLARPGNKVYYFDDALFPSGPLDAPYFAIGTGSNYAMGAMYSGASAFEAVGAACKFDIWSGGEVKCVLVQNKHVDTKPNSQVATKLRKDTWVDRVMRTGIFEAPSPKRHKSGGFTGSNGACQGD